GSAQMFPAPASGTPLAHTSVKVAATPVGPKPAMSGPDTAVAPHGLSPPLLWTGGVRSVSWSPALPPIPGAGPEGSVPLPAALRWANAGTRGQRGAGAQRAGPPE